jgi:hypothetical protein
MTTGASSMCPARATAAEPVRARSAALSASCAPGNQGPSAAKVASALAATPSSSRPKASHGRRRRVANRAYSALPTTSPVRYTASTSAKAATRVPTNGAAACVHTISQPSATAPATA